MFIRVFREGEYIGEMVCDTAVVQNQNLAILVRSPGSVTLLRRVAFSRDLSQIYTGFLHSLEVRLNDLAKG